MKFDRTLSSLNRLKEKQSNDVTVLDVFNIFHDMCDDIRSNVGMGVAELPLGDSGNATTRMSWIGRTILKINKDNSDNISLLGEKARRFQDVCNEITAITEEIENAENSLKNNKSKCAELNEKVTKLKEIKQADYEVIEKCHQLEKLIAEYGSVKTAELNNKHKELSREFDEKQRVYYAQKTEYNELERTYEQLLSEEEIQSKKTNEKNSEIKTVTENLTVLKERYSELIQNIEGLSKECSYLDNQIVELESELSKYNDTKIPQLKKKSEELISKINSCKSVYKEECIKCNNLEIELNNLQSNEKEKTTEVAEKEIKISDLKNKIFTLSEKNITLQKEIDIVKSDYDKLYKENSAQEQELCDYNSVKIPELTEKFNNLKQEIDRHRLIYADNEEKFNNLEIELNALCLKEKAKKTEIAEREIEISGLKDSLSVLSEKNNALEEKITSVKAEYDKLHNKVSEQESELTDYNSVKIPELTEKFNNLKQEIDRHRLIYADNEEKFNNLEIELNALCSKEKAKKTEIAEREIEVSGLKDSLSVLFEKNNALEEKITSVKAEYDKLYNKISEQESELTDYNSVKIPELNKKSESLVQKIDYCKSVCTDDIERCKKLENEISLLCSKEKAKKTEIAQKEIEISDLNEKLSNLDIQRKNMEDKISCLDKEKQKLIEDNRELRKQLETYDVQTLRDMLDEKNAEIKAKQEECDRINTEIGEQQQKLVDLSEDFMNKKKMKENLIWECDSRIGEIKSKIEDFDRQLREYEEEKSCIISKSNQREKELSEFENWFKSLEVTNYRDNIFRCEKAIGVMKKAMNELATETGLENLVNADARRSLNEYKRYFRDSIGDIEQRLKEYQHSYRKVVDIIGNGGTVI